MRDSIRQPELELYDLAGGICFDPECQKAADTAFLVALAVPLVILVIAVIFLFQDSEPAEAQVFDDPDTSAHFLAPKGQSPERDKAGKLTFRPISYVPWPVEADAQAERVRVAVGPAGQEAHRTFVFDPILAQPSQLVGVSLPRPMGLILEEDQRLRRVVVAGFVEGSVAEQRSKVGRLQTGRSKSSVQEGDVLRACTCTTLEYGASALLGAKPATKMRTMYGADGQTWPEVMGALSRGSADDGEVTLIFERYVGNVN